MNDKRRKMMTAVTVTASVALLATACSGKNAAESPAAGTASQTTTASATASASAQPPKAATLNIMLWGDKPNQFDQIVSEFERQTKDTLNVKLNVTFTPQADYVNKLKLKLAAGEHVDIAFDAPWMNMNTFISQDIYTNLDPYFNNDQYPGLKTAFGEKILTNNKFTGADGQLHTYGVPLGQYLGDLGVVYYRKDLADKYGMSGINSIEELQTYYDNVLKNDKNVIPLSIKNDGTYGANGVIESNKEMPNLPELGVWPLLLGPNITAQLYIKDNKVTDVTMTGDKLSGIANFPAPLNVKDYTTFETVREWHDKGYIEKEPIIRKDARGTFTSGKAASMIEGLSNFSTLNTELKAVVPNAQLGVFLFQENVRNKMEHNPQLLSNFRYWNFLCVPKTSENADRAIAFINWIFENRANHDLFELGIEGKNWEAVGEDKFTYPAGIDLNQNYNFAGYLLTNNPNYIRLPAEVPDELVQYYRYEADENAYVKSALTGFVFNQEPVKNELANPDIANVWTDQLSYMLGMVANPTEGLIKLQQKWEKNARMQADIEKIKAEVKSQAQAFLDAQPAGQ
ncbi:extracellular solute-binding protein [Cohnella sp. 56]|uniref:extracellular solute-binding protein n=1 Tax=Cohnella sp. 56 TaxID=3113722 RepID=UPI0030EA8E27